MVFLEYLRPVVAQCSFPEIAALVVVSFSACACCLILGNAIYNVYFHPLSVYPGPKLWAASRLPYTYMVLRGEPHKRMLDMHKTYGDVVRIAPDELAYFGADAWKDIMGHRQPGQPENNKDHIYTKRGQGSIIASSRDDHRRMRMTLSSAFSTKSLDYQEPLIMTYVDLLMRRLRQRAERQEPVDLVAWFNFCTFDIIGDLAFGEPFGCLEHSYYHPWVELIFQNVKLGAIGIALDRLPGVGRLLECLVPRELLRQAEEHKAYGRAKVGQRMAQGTRPDFMQSMIDGKSDSAKAMSRAEIEANADILIIGGSETTATALSGAAYFLMTNPDTLKKLTEEVRSSFSSEGEITIRTAAQLRYMDAVLEESLRLYPPAPVAMPRRTPPGGNIVGDRFIPGNTILGTWQWPMYHSEKNFTDPFAFIPERWLGQDERFAQDKKGILQPFSYGPRNCIGKNLANSEMRLILAKLIWRFDLELCDSSKGWIDHKVYMLYEKPPLEVKLHPRTL